MNYADTHIHLQDYSPADVKNVVTNANKNNVCEFVNISSHPTDWQKVLGIASEFKRVIPAIGVHPWYIAEASADWVERLESLLQQNPQLWLGECGIDRLKNPNTGEQMEILQTQIALAKKYQRPLIIHAVKADEILRPLLPVLPEKTIFHSFTGSAEWGKELQKYGFYLGLNFSILRKKNYSELLQRLNIQQLLLETDGPYQSGQKGVQSLPQNLPLLAEKIAVAFNIPVCEFSEIIAANWQKFKEK